MGSASSSSKNRSLDYLFELINNAEGRKITNNDDDGYEV
jgi:hypothetical protein